MGHAYDDTDEALIDSYRRIHANGEETHVHILSCGDRYVTVAADVDPREFKAVAGDCLAFSPTVDAAKERGQAWMEQNPRGVAEQSGGGGFGEKLWNGIKKLDQSAQQNTETQQ